MLNGGIPSRIRAVGLISAALLILGGAVRCFALDLAHSGPGWSATMSGPMISPTGSTLTSSSTATLLAVTAGDAEDWEISASVTVQRSDFKPIVDAPDFMVKGTGDGNATVGSITWTSANFVTLGAGSTQLCTGTGSRTDIPLQYRTVVSFDNQAGTYEYAVTYTLAAP